MPFLSIGDDIGHREVRYRGNSPLTGGLVVEDVTDGGVVYRRLVFLSGMVLVQSQARLIRGDDKVPDLCYSVAILLSSQSTWSI